MQWVPQQTSTRNTKGFTLIEILVTIVIIGILLMLGYLGFNGLQKRAAENGALSNLDQASSVIEQYALHNNGEFPDTAYLTANFTNNKDVNLSVVLGDGSSGGNSTYSGLSNVQNGVLFFETCNEIIGESRPDRPTLKYGQGINNGGQTTSYIAQGQACWVYASGRTQVNTAWSPQNFNVPITSSSMSTFIAGINSTDPWFPDRNHVEKQFYQELSDRFLAKGGTYPVTTFWNPSYGCNAWNCWDAPGFEPLPVLPPSTGPTTGPNELTKSYCIIATHAKYNDILYSFSSSKLSSSTGNCS